MELFYGYTEKTFHIFLKKNDSIKLDVGNQHLIMAIPKDKINLYSKLIEACNGFELKGKNMLYTSSNGYMFSQLNKAGEIGIRLPKDLQEEFKGKYNATKFTSYGATMRDYVKVPEELFEDFQTIVDYLELGFKYVNSLEPK